MNRTKKFLMNTTSSAVLQVITMIAGFIVPRIMLSHFGSEINGLVSSISQFISYFNLVEAGLSSAAIYALYQPLAEKNYPAVGGIVAAAKKLYNQGGTLFCILGIALAVLYPFFVKTPLLTMLEVGLLVLVLCASGALEFFTMAKYRVLLTADQKLYVISVASIVQVVVNTGIIALAAGVGVNIVLLRLLALGSVFLRSAILHVYCKKRYACIPKHENPNTAALHKRWDALYLQILGVIQTGAPIVILSVMPGNLKMVSVYTIYNMVIAGIGGIVAIFTSGLSASFGEILARKERETIKRSYATFEYMYYSIITIVYTITFLTIMPFVRIYTMQVTDTNYDLPLVGFLMVLNGLLFSVKVPQGMLVIAAGHYKETKWQTTLQGAISVVLSACLAPFFGLPGILIGSIASNLYRCVDLLWYVPKKITGMGMRHSVIRAFRIFLCVGLSFIPFFSYQLTPDSFLTWGLCALGVGVYVTVVTVGVNVLLEKREAKNVWQRLRGLVSQK